jgi:hypothetical protein
MKEFPTNSLVTKDSTPLLPRSVTSYDSEPVPSSPNLTIMGTDGGGKRIPANYPHWIFVNKFFKNILNMNTKK